MDIETLLFFAALVLAAGYDPRLIADDTEEALAVLLELYEPAGSA